MKQIVLDATAAKQFHEVMEAVEICGPSGEVLGRFHPKYDMTDYEPVSPDVSDEELERRANSNEKNYTTAEVLAYLEKLQ